MEIAQYQIKRKKTKEEFIEISNKKHNFKYDYSKTEYKGVYEPVCIICSIHGEFWQKPSVHMHTSGCQKCAGSYMDTEFFIEKSNKKHDFKYDYSKVKYVNGKTNVCIICKEHGEFEQNPGHHMNGSGCKLCHLKKPNTRLSNTSDFINKSKIIHNNFYNYDKVIYVKSRTPVTIICPNHGEFEQTPFGHLQGYGCQKCASERTINKLKIPQIDVLKRFTDRHGNKYDYSKVVYTGLDSYVSIICPEHGDFLQTPHSHWYGQGCPNCNESKLESDIRILLENNEIEYIYTKKFPWLGRQSLDFYLPYYNVAIECQGEQHFEIVDFFGGEDDFNERLILDENKYNLCKENNVPLFYFAYMDVENYYDKIYLDKQELLTEILKYKK